MAQLSSPDPLIHANDELKTANIFKRMGQLGQTVYTPAKPQKIYPVNVAFVNPFSSFDELVLGWELLLPKRTHRALRELRNKDNFPPQSSLINTNHKRLGKKKEEIEEGLVKPIPYNYHAEYDSDSVTESDSASILNKDLFDTESITSQSEKSVITTNYGFDFHFHSVDGALSSNGCERKEEGDKLDGSGHALERTEEIVGSPIAKIEKNAFVESILEDSIGSIAAPTANLPKFRCRTEKSPPFACSSKKIQLHVGSGHFLHRFKPGSIIYCTMNDKSFIDAGRSKDDVAHAKESYHMVLATINSYGIGIQFIWTECSGPSIFELTYAPGTSVSGDMVTLAEAFFPGANPSEYIIYLYESVFEPNHRDFIFNALCHEFGHTLAMRHWNAATKEKSEKSVHFPPNSDNKDSMMGQLENLEKMLFHDKDIEFLKKFYAMKEGEMIDSFEIRDVMLGDPKEGVIQDKTRGNVTQNGLKKGVSHDLWWRKFGWVGVLFVGMGVGVLFHRIAKT